MLFSLILGPLLASPARCCMIPVLLFPAPASMCSIPAAVKYSFVSVKTLQSWTASSPLCALCTCKGRWTIHISPTCGYKIVLVHTALLRFSACAAVLIGLVAVVSLCKARYVAGCTCMSQGPVSTGASSSAGSISKVGYKLFGTLCRDASDVFGTSQLPPARRDNFNDAYR